MRKALVRPGRRSEVETTHPRCTEQAPTGFGSLDVFLYAIIPWSLFPQSQPASVRAVAPSINGTKFSKEGHNSRLPASALRSRFFHFIS